LRRDKNRIHPDGIPVREGRIEAASRERKEDADAEHRQMFHFVTSPEENRIPREWFPARLRRDDLER
jgi:hypothetical protein